MTIDPARFTKLLAEFKLEALFNECGWDRPNMRAHEVTADGQAYALAQVAHKRGVAVWQVSPDAKGEIPSRATLLKIDQEATKLVREHLLIFIDAARATMTWLWVLRAPGQPSATRTHTWHKGSSGESLRQKLLQIVWSLEEEEAITLTEVITGLKRAFDRDVLSKKFYDRFKTEHEKFRDFIKGITAEGDQAWYASIMLNRLMFVYFIQRKGFLDGDPDYLTNRMRQVTAKAGKGKFHSFYRLFLRRLFHEGLGTPAGERVKDLAVLIGKVPYLNGGLFDLHQLEEQYPDVDIPDDGFTRLFAFFDDYDWHLDDRPLKSGKEINPDVLGYIFEKYINQKQMGAYYTKEDITEYICKNTVVPHLLAATRERCKVAFEGETAVWRMLAADPDRYLYPAMKTGLVDAKGKLVPEQDLPEFVQTGMKDPKARMFDKRYNRGEAVFVTATGERGTLPTETWREYVERRTRCIALREKLARGEVREIDDLITLNLNIRQFMQDVIDTCAGPDVLRAVWQAIVGRVPEKAHEKYRHGITILDPTCGSGAFLFAALNILEPLYEACLDRMEGFVEDAKKLGKRPDIEFERALKKVAQHPSRRYYIYKSIILYNLFGVDIMAEAVEICKLRLFLKLVSQVDADRELEPLPDIDFNIRTGNSLVGFATEAQFDAAGDLASDQNHQKEIKAKMADLADLFELFRGQQTKYGGKVTLEDKRRLREKLDGLASELDRYLAGDYGVEPDKAQSFNQWRESHQPFHWIAEFFGVLREGGFDVVVGNPPYVEMHKVRDYQISGDLQSASCGNLYAPVTERAISLCNEHSGGLGLIVPLSVFATERMRPLQECLYSQGHFIALSHFDVYPTKLFEGAKQRLTIIVRRPAISGAFLTTSYNRWFGPFRESLFQVLSYSPARYFATRGYVEKVSGAIHTSVLDRLSKFAAGGIREARTGPDFFVHRIPYNYVKALDFIPYFWNEVDGEKKSEDYKPYAAAGQGLAGAALACLNSNLFFMWWHSSYEGYHCGKHEITSFPLGANSLSADNRSALNALAAELMTDLKKNKNRKEAKYQKTGQVIYDEFFPRKSKQVIDSIDVALAKHFQWSDEQLDFVVNFDIKFRVSESEEEV